MNRYYLQLPQHIILAIAFLCASVPGVAQSGKLEIKYLEKLADKAAEVNDVTLDGALLHLATSILSKSDDPDAAQVIEVIKGLKGIYIKSFEFDEPNQYSQADVEAIRSQLNGPHWQRIVTSHTKRSGEKDEVYLFKKGDKIGGVVVLVAEAKELTVVNIVGSIDVDKLDKLGGHFGIPDEFSDRPKHKNKHKTDDASPAGKKPTEKTPADKKGADDDDDEAQYTSLTY
jgi:hypothetical protein